MRTSIENTYGKAMKSLMLAVNPIKKKIVKTHCIVHKYINLQAIEILKDEGYEEEYEFFKSNIKCINKGATWADQDFKSTNHFFHVHHKKGLYGFSDSLTEFKKYYNIALQYKDIEDLDNAFYFFGAACHLIQDATVPQHANNKLLKKHRDFEIWIINRIITDYSFDHKGGIVIYENVDDYIKNNSQAAFVTHNKYSSIEVKEDRYLSIAEEIIHLAQQSTAGLMINFYKEIKK